MELVEIVKSAVDTQKDDDMTDRFNHTYMGTVLIMFACIITTEQYVGTPIKCWSPPQFTDNYIGFTDKICWIQNTYRVARNLSVPETDNYINKPQIRYYQWAPLIFTLLALLYQLPCVFWRSNNTTCGLHLKSIIDIASKYQEETERDKKDESIKILTKLFTYYREQKTQNSSRNPFNKKLILLYMTTKVLYLLNSIGQFVFIDLLLCDGKMQFYGILIARDFFQGNSYESKFFPRVAFCDFYIREMGHEIVGFRYSVQCVLSINLYLEAIFTVYWYLLFILIVLNFINTFRWIYHGLSGYGSRSYILKNIRPELLDSVNSLNRSRRNFNSPLFKKRLHDFADKYLESDGIFVIRLISRNVSDLVATDLVSSLYENYKILKEAEEWNRISSDF